MRTKKWPTTMTVAVAMVDGDGDDDGDSFFLWGYMLYADEHVVVVVCREADRRTDGRIYACCCGYLMWVCDVGSKGYPLNHCTAYIHMHIHI